MEFSPTQDTVKAALDYAAKSPWYLVQSFMWPSTPEGRELLELREEVERLKAQIAAMQAEAAAA